MDCDTVRFDISGNPHVRVGGIGDEQRRIVRSPSRDEIVPSNFCQFVGEQVANFDVAERIDPQVRQPRAEGVRLDFVFDREIRRIRFSLGGNRIGGRVEITCRSRKDSIAP